MRAPRGCRFVTGRAAARPSPVPTQASTSFPAATCLSTSTTSMPCCARSRASCDPLASSSSTRSTGPGSPGCSRSRSARIGWAWFPWTHMTGTCSSPRANSTRRSPEQGCKCVISRGLGPSLDPLAVGRALLHRATGRMDRNDALALVGPTPFESVLYMGWASPVRQGGAGGQRRDRRRVQRVDTKRRVRREPGRRRLRT